MKSFLIALSVLSFEGLGQVNANLLSFGRERLDELMGSQASFVKSPPTTSNILSRMAETTIDCDDVNNLTVFFLTSCECREDPSSDILILDCGQCIGCANVTDVPEYAGQEICSSRSIDWGISKTQPVNYTFSDLFDNSAVDFSWSFEFQDGSPNITIEYSLLNQDTNSDSVSINGVSCDLELATTYIPEDNFTYQEVDCTASPLVDKVFDLCSTQAFDGTPFALFNSTDLADSLTQCLGPNGEVWVVQTSGDPHITTMDGLRFDCQAIGEFIFVTSQGGSPFDQVEIQGRFEDAATGVQASVMTGIVVQFPFGGLSYTVQISLDDRPNTCDAQLYVNGAPTGSFSFLVTETPEKYIIKSPSSFFEIQLVRHVSNTFGCFFTAVVVLPTDADTQYFGLYGTPNGDPSDEWVTTSGTPIQLPNDPAELLFETAYNYCVDNWCIKQAGGSLFSYPDGKGFADYNGCDIPYNNAIEQAVNNAGAELVSLCAGDTGCLVDGALGTRDDAEVALKDEEVFEEVTKEIEAVLVPAPAEEPSAAPSAVPTADSNDQCECGLDSCRFFQVFCLLRNNCRRKCGCRRLLRC